MCAVQLTRLHRSAAVRTAGLLRPAGSRLRAELDWRRTRSSGADLALFHAFVPAPTGGGSQFLRALVGELKRRGLEIEVDRISGGTTTCLLNSFNFDFARLRRFAREDVRFVHRVDGPIGAYRGYDDGTDRQILRINHELADATVFQSRYSLEKHRELGLELRDPIVITNAADPRIFHPPGERAPLEGRRLRIVATSWSDNPRKGADVLAWLDANLDPDRYELTFAGQTRLDLRRARVVAPLASEPLAELLRAHDVFLAASLEDPCSNALLEGLSCGLPALYRRSGGHPELVGEGGVGFDEPEEVPQALERLVAGLDAFRAAIRVPALADVADRYREVLACGPA
ncbi:MAG: glycosyltransferase family 4 protein [Gaiellaceae bacterium]